MPLDIHLKQTPDKGKLFLIKPQIYQWLISRPIYLTITRPDITSVVHIWAQYMQRPTNAHLQAADYLPIYLLKNPTQGFLFSASSATQITAYCYSDWLVVLQLEDPYQDFVFSLVLIPCFGKITRLQLHTNSFSSMRCWKIWDCLINHRLCSSVIIKRPSIL